MPVISHHQGSPARLALLTCGMILLAAWVASAAQGLPESPVAGGDPSGEAKEVTVAQLTLYGTIAAAVISALGTVIAAWIAVQKQKQVETLEKSSTAASKKLEQQLLERYGFRAQSVFAVVEINAAGDAVITQGWKGVEILQDVVTLPSLPLKYDVASPQGRLLFPPTLKAQASNGGKFPKDVTLVARETSEKRCNYAIEVMGGLTRQDPPLDLTTSIEVKLLCLMSNEAIAAAYAGSPFKKEYHELEAVTPADHLDLEVRFPAGFQVKAFPGVFLGTETLFFHASELNRIRGGFEEVGSGARLRVENPLPGFNYLIYWTPSR